MAPQIIARAGVDLFQAVKPMGEAPLRV